MTHTIAFLHSSPANVATFDVLLDGAGVETLHSVHPEWLDRARSQGVDLDLLADVRAHLATLAAKSDLVLCTCSTLGPIAESMKDARIVRVDAPVMDAAVAVGGEVLLVLCLESTLAASRHLLERSFEAAGRKAQYRVLMCADAWPAFEAGDMAEFSANIARWVRAALSVEPSISCVVLGQASMHAVLPSLVGAGIPVLSSPRIAVQRILALLAR